MSRKQKKRSTIAFTPLVFLDRASLPEAGVLAAAVLDELPPDLAVPAWDVLRAIYLHTTTTPLRALYGADALRHWEEELLRSEFDPGLRQPLAVVVGQLSQSEEAADLPLLSRACLVVAEWALERGARRTALAFQEASALCWPDNGRCALAVGRAYHTRGLLKDAERWLRRARNLTLWDEDWEAHAFAVSTLGMVYWDGGSGGKPVRLLLRARRVARRHGLRQLEGEILHNLLVVAITSDDPAHVEEYAAAAFERYLPNHHRIPALAYDIAYFWLTRGYAARALLVFRRLLPYFREPRQQFQVLAATARAAGVEKVRNVFDRAWAQAMVLVGDHEGSVSVPAALVDLGIGAASFELFDDAGRILRRALREAEEQNQSDVVIRADAWLNDVNECCRFNELALTRRRHPPAQPSDRLAERIADVLTAGRNLEPS